MIDPSMGELSKSAGDRIIHHISPTVYIWFDFGLFSRRQGLQIAKQRFP